MVQRSVDFFAVSRERVSQIRSARMPHACGSQNADLKARHWYISRAEAWPCMCSALGLMHSNVVECHVLTLSHGYGSTLEYIPADPLQQAHCNEAHLLFYVRSKTSLLT